MNVLYNKFIKKKYEELVDNYSNNIYFYNYREFEYRTKLEKFIQDTFDYITNNTNDEFEFEYEWELKESNINYKYYRTDCYLLSIEYKYKYKKESEGSKFSIRIPKLSDKHFFYIYNNIYVPVLKLKTYAIRFGRERILIDTLFTTFVENHLPVKGNYNPTDEKLSVNILTSKKILTVDFLYLLFKDDPFLEELEKFFNTTIQIYGNKRIINNLINHLIIFDKSGKKDLNEILTNVFFNNYSKELYEFELGFKPKDFKDIIKFLYRECIINYKKDRTDLRDLSNRRFIFLEDIMKPFFASAFNFLLMLSQSNKKSKFSMHRDRLISVFLNGDQYLRLTPAKYLYDWASPYSGIKSLIAVQMEGDIKKFMRTIHKSYYGIICPISVSSDPGVQIHVNPLTRLTKFGHIEKHFKPLNQ